MKRLGLALAALCLAVPAAAQQQPAEFISITTLTIQGSGVSEYEDFAKKVMSAAAKVDPTARVFAYQGGAGSSGYTYSFVRPFSKWGDMDAWMSVSQMLMKAHGDVEGGRILKAGRSPIKESRTEVFRLLKDRSTRPRLFDPPPAHTLVFRTEVRPEMVPAYEEYLDKLKAAQEKVEGTPTATRRVAVLGPANTYVTSLPFDKYAERDSWPPPADVLRQAYGEAEARRLNEVRLKSIKNAEVFVVNYRPDLSRIPAAMQ